MWMWGMGKEEEGRGDVEAIMMSGFKFDSSGAANGKDGGIKGRDT